VSVLPKGWCEARLDEVSKVVTGKTPSKKNQEYFNGNIPFIKPGDVINQGVIESTIETISEEGAKTVPTIPPGSVTVTCIGNLGRAAITKVNSATNQQINTAIPYAEISSKYLYYYLLTIKEWMEKESSATTVAIINKSRFSAAPIKVAPKNEQTRIADKLDSMLAKVDAAQTRLDKIPNILKRFRQSVLAAATSGELTKEWRLTNSQLAYDLELLRQNIYDNWLEARHAEFKRKGKTPKSTSWLKKFPGPNFIDSMIPTWISLSLENIAEVVDPNPSHRMPSYVVEGKAFISSENIININKLNFSKGKKVTAEEVEKQKTRYEIVEGTFAFTRIGTIGKSVLLPKPHDYGISHAMAVVNPYKSIMDSAFLILTMNCETILKQASHGVQSVGVPDLGIGKMKSFTVPLPPLMEQQEIVRRVESLFTMVDTVEKQYKDAKARTNRLTQSILAKAFRGELVPQDDNDEPASELLARIKAASDNLTSKPKMAKKGSAK
jgi:type I restriction enzyme S subunit